MCFFLENVLYIYPFFRSDSTLQNEYNNTNKNYTDNCRNLSGSILNGNGISSWDQSVAITLRGQGDGIHNGGTNNKEQKKILYFAIHTHTHKL